ncbi:MAG: nitrate reductase [Calditrichaeota bacterium]|nr:MAG: nitrate reductase [Calditrichota bacterium]
MLKQTLKFILIAGIAFLIISCSSSARQNRTTPSPQTDKKIPDTALSYRHAELSGEADTPMSIYSDNDPGESTRIQRSFENAPPLIPHNIEDFVPITREDNECLSCHDPNEAEEAEAPSVPASHLYDLRRNKPLDHVNNANYNCTLCHVPQSNAPVLIGNNFKAEFRTEKLKKSSDLLDRINEGVDGD